MIANHDGASSLPDRIPPFNLEAERGVLGACLLDNRAIDLATRIIRAEDFFRDSHVVAWQAILDLRDAGKPVDFVSLAEYLERRRQFDQVGGDEFLSELSNAAPHAANVEYHADIVRQKADLRLLISACGETLGECYNPERTSEEILEAAECRVLGVADRHVRSNAIGTDSLVDETMTGVARREAGEIDGIDTGFHDLDSILTGLRPEQLVILAARPSQGKTALGLAIATHVARDVGVLYVSLEMATAEIGERILSAAGMIDSHLLRHPWQMTAVQKGRLHKAAADTAGLKLVVDGSPSRSVSQIAAEGRRMKARSGLGLVVVDYLGLIEGRRLRGESRQEEVARISKGLKAMARNLKVPVLALQQLNRQSELREDKRPRMADLRESGQIEADADAVLLLHRPEYYDPNDRPGHAEVIVAKNRNGATGTIQLMFTKSCTRFDTFIPYNPAEEQAAY